MTIEGEETTDFIPMIADEGNNSTLNLNDGDVLPILTLRNMVLFPGIVMPVAVGRQKSLRLIREIYKKGGIIGTLAQIDKSVDDPTPADLYTTGTVAQIVRILEMPDNSTTVILQGRKPFNIIEVVEEEPYMKARVQLIEENDKTPRNKDFKALIEAIKDMSSRMVRMSGDLPQEINFAIRNIESTKYFINFVCANMGLNLEDKQRLLQAESLEARAYMLLNMMTKEMQLLEIKSSIQNKAIESIDKQQREYFLQQQMKTIQKELGGTSNEQDISDIRKKAEKKKWTEEVKVAVYKEIDKLESMPAHAADYAVQLNYVHTLVDLPWGEYTKDNFNLKRAERILNRDHFGLDDVKERILEHLAVLKLKGDLKSPIICLYGPPGVGKTSLGKSVAEALGRKYARISLGGLHDEAEIRGHRRTYIGAMPGRIIQNLLKANSANPVFILDEIDKVGNDFKGDPASALLEVLDPEQNSTFHDNYLDIDFDLSKVLFIATANSTSTISRPLLDRMEMINISGYILEEKIEIASKHLFPKELDNHGIDPKTISLPRKTIEAIIEGYTRESGVRALDKQLAKLCRKLARKIAMDEEFDHTITPDSLKEWIGPVLFTREAQSRKEEIGIVTGLAWTSVGGEILEIETSINTCKGPGALTMTGNLGNVMKESATLGMEYIKANHETYDIDSEFFATHNVHIHVPEGAIPKDGPSAGITITTSMLSAITGRRVRKHLAMTGEITLHGKVLPVGGIKEKILAAKRAGVTDIMLCAENKKDIEEIKSLYLKGVTFHYVTNIREVVDFALLPNNK
ncbi:MAG: endopeptidase La [Paludibacteraceae bacterium]|nr:endopeptidase La [Paludibacteraceae bacterium]